MVAFSVYRHICPRVAQAVICAARQSVNANLHEQISIHGREIDALAGLLDKSLVNIVIPLNDFMLISVVLSDI